MAKLVLKPVSIKADRVIAVSQDRRFLSLEDGTIIDSKLKPILNTLGEGESCGMLITLPHNVRALMSEAAFLDLFEYIEPDFDVEAVRDSIAGCDFVNSGSVTVCVLTDARGGKFVGSFHALASLGMTEDERQELAYADAFHQLMLFEINTRVRLMPV